ncbi:MAG TPA: hypothetical protein VM689_27175 [Aliidongia sp.]|nr:hypothetical protein [Aliidongia sp.]
MPGLVSARFVGWLVCGFLISLVFVVARLDWFFIPLPDSWAPSADFDCPQTGAIFTYDIIATRTGRQNRQMATGRQGYYCGVRSDAMGNWTMYGALGFQLAEDTEQGLIRQIWPLQAGKAALWQRGDRTGYWDKLEYRVVSYGLAHTQGDLYWAYQVRKSYWHDGTVKYVELWWAPSLRWNIRQWNTWPGGTEVYDWTLVSAWMPQTEPDTPGADRGQVLLPRMRTVPNSSS